jgi:hypothetical protein
MARHARKSKQKKIILLFTTCIAVMIVCGVFVLLQNGEADAWHPRMYRLLAFWENRGEEPQDIDAPDGEETATDPEAETPAENEPTVPPRKTRLQWYPNHRGLLG